MSDGQGPSRIADNDGAGGLLFIEESQGNFRHHLFIFFIIIFLVLEEDGVTVAVLPRKEVIRRLRDRNEPISLFGETDIEAFRRLRKLEISEPEINRVF